MKRIMCIDLTMFNQTKLRELAEKHQLNVDFLLKNKSIDLAKIWIDLDTGVLIAFTTKKYPKMTYTDAYMEQLQKIQPIEMPKKDVSLDVDSILDKISKYGIESLNEKEKIFLSGQS